MNRKKFVKQLCKLVSIQSASYDTKLMMRHIKDVVQSIAGCTISYDTYGNMYVVKGQGNYPTMVCHTDTVHAIEKAKIIPIEVEGNIVAFNSTTMEQHGTGGDDKVGIHITIQLLKTQPNMKAVFFLDEEVGCVGSSKANMDFFDDSIFVLQCDRRGYSDFVNKISGTKLYEKNFQKEIKDILKKYKRTETNGGMTDVLEIAYQTKLSVANMSCGYYNPHTENEYINIQDVINTFNLCQDIFNQVKTIHKVKTDRFQSYNNYNYGYGYDYASEWMYTKSKRKTYQTLQDQAIELEIQKICGHGCDLKNGYCASCMMTTDEMNEFYTIENDESKYNTMEVPLQLGPADTKRFDKEGR